MDLKDKQVMYKLGSIFWNYAYLYRIQLTTTDLEYLNEVIKTDKCYPLIEQSELSKQEYNKLESAYAGINQIVFYDKFYNDKKCPPGIKSVLFLHLGILRDGVNEFSPTILNNRYKHVEQWLENVRGK